ncbi:DUF1801 domain-containing protein [Algoriphagus machipongonensis]|uniref:YdhG-like domain-containing protein n=1 Tax=Algoriphagus machipongonensis TaxID=388413 RepID=A3I0E5_9BACT|nr:DUF1801 domain-containing protein [Algoriphagus machipongonensis]EAZ79941.1 hypothetical protein ALPR1_14969 [Algoriphagus machipongonensis]
MASTNKTTETEVSVSDFIDSFVSSERKKKESFQLIDLMSEWSGFEAKMWGPSIIGFGRYHYKYDSGHEGEMPLIGFSPRKAAFSLYVYTESEANKLLLDQLGKFKMGKACIYVNKLEDINLPVLEKLCKGTMGNLNRRGC